MHGIPIKEIHAVLYECRGIPRIIEAAFLMGKPWIIAINGASIQQVVPKTTICGTEYIVQRY